MASFCLENSNTVIHTINLFAEFFLIVLVSLKICVRAIAPMEVKKLVSHHIFLLWYGSKPEFGKFFSAIINFLPVLAFSP